MVNVQDRAAKQTQVLARLDELSKLTDDFVMLLTEFFTDEAQLAAPAANQVHVLDQHAPGGLVVWDTSESALEDYDAAQLVALRADHRADQHAPEKCHVCAVLERRLGSL